jgi:predicted amidohydrolase
VHGASRDPALSGYTTRAIASVEMDSRPAYYTEGGASVRKHCAPPCHAKHARRRRKRLFRVGYYQFCPLFGQVDRNLQRVVRALRGADADLIVLPELAFTGYCFRDRDELAALAEDPRASPTVDALVALCRERDLYLVTGFAEQHADSYFNSALLLGPHGVLHTYRKLHLFGTEMGCFDPGDLPLEVSSVRGVKLGMMICFDWVFPEVARVLTLSRADLICHPANLVLTYCQQAMTVRCIENLVFAVTANRYGTEVRPHTELAFTGQSQVVAPRGAVLHRAPADRDDLYVAAVDVEQARNKHLTDQNDILIDRRPAFYGELCEHPPAS